MNLSADGEGTSKSLHEEPIASDETSNDIVSGNVNERSPESKLEKEASSTNKKKRGMRFWLVVVSLLLSTFLSALDVSALATALPTISRALDTTEFGWIVNAYTVASVAFIPWSGGLAQIFGRRIVLLAGLAFFAFGSALCGAAKNLDMMLSGRVFAGAGAGNILCLTEIVLSDLVPLSERGTFQGAFSAVWALASAVAPLIGAGFAQSNWRWLFYLNLPLTGVVAGIVLVCLKVKTPPGTFREKFARIDWVGNAIFILATCLFVVGLTSGGAKYPWNHAAVLAPLVIGLALYVGWYFVERFLLKHPTVPFGEITHNRTSVIGFLTTFLHGTLACSVFLFWPVYFQACKSSSPIRSAVQYFPIAFTNSPFAAAAGASIAILKAYKPQNIIAWVLMMIGFGLMSLIKWDSPVGYWAGLPIVLSAGIGILWSATTFPVLAPLKPQLAGQALAFLVFTRSAGFVVGVAICTAILHNQIGLRAPPGFYQLFPNGNTGAVEALVPIIKTLPEPLQTQTKIAYAESFRWMWISMIPITGVALILALCIKEIALATTTDETYALKEKKRKNGAEST